MKIHFGGSSIGLKKLRSEYLAIRDSIRKLHKPIVRDWLSPENIDKKISSEEAYAETEKAIARADVVILEASFDTSSIGKQLMLALELELPVLILAYEDMNPESNLEKFLDKRDAQLVKKVNYNDGNLIKTINDFLVWAERNTKMVRFNLEIERKLDNYLKDKARTNGTSKAKEIRDLIVEDMQKSSKN